MESLFRVYDASECGADGYPRAWHDLDTAALLPWCELNGSLADHGLTAPVGVKDLARAESGFRCERCRHPYKPGAAVWGDPEPGKPALQYPQGVLMATETLLDLEQPVATDRLPPLWSPCTPDCRHAGPMRVMCRQLDGGTGWEAFDPTPEACGPAVEAVAPTPVQAAWRILTVHHLNGVKRDLRWWNLASLCQRCHLTIQKKVQMERVWAWEHSDWFRPYAAGFYASSYLGEELTREETMARLDELLALERMA